MQRDLIMPTAKSPKSCIQSIFLMGRSAERVEGKTRLASGIADRLLAWFSDMHYQGDTPFAA